MLVLRHTITMEFGLFRIEMEKESESTEIHEKRHVKIVKLRHFRASDHSEPSGSQDVPEHNEYYCNGLHMIYVDVAYWPAISRVLFLPGSYRIRLDIHQQASPGQRTLAIP